MEELIIVTIVPALVILTTFLFNLGVKEMIDFKHGLNTYYFKPMAGMISFLYLFGLFLGMTDGKFVSSNKEANLSNIIILVTIVILSIIYGFLYLKFHKKRDEIVIGRNQYYPNKEKYYMLTFAGMVLVTVSSFWVTCVLNAEFILVYDMLILKSKPIDYFFLMSFFAILFICYSIIIIAAGYLYNYGQLFNFKKYKIIFTKEFREILNKINNNIEIENDIKNDIENGIINAYVIIESEENMRIKIDKMAQSSIIIKKEHILNISFIDESQVTIEESSVE